MKRLQFSVLAIIVGFFLALPGSTCAGDEEAADIGSGEALKEKIAERKEARENQTPEEKEAIQKERQSRREERKQLGSQYKGAVASLTNEQKDAIRKSVQSMKDLTPREKALIKRMLKIV